MGGVSVGVCGRAIFVWRRRFAPSGGFLRHCKGPSHRTLNGLPALWRMERRPCKGRPTPAEEFRPYIGLGPIPAEGFRPCTGGRV